MKQPLVNPLIYGVFICALVCFATNYVINVMSTGTINPILVFFFGASIILVFIIGLLDKEKQKHTEPKDNNELI